MLEPLKPLSHVPYLKAPALIGGVITATYDVKNSSKHHKC
jgi:hypothetical protein